MRSSRNTNGARCAAWSLHGKNLRGRSPRGARGAVRCLQRHSDLVGENNTGWLCAFDENAADGGGLRFLEWGRGQFRVPVCASRVFCKHMADTCERERTLQWCKDTGTATEVSVLIKHASCLQWGVVFATEQFSSTEKGEEFTPMPLFYKRWWWRHVRWGYVAGPRRRRR